MKKLLYVLLLASLISLVGCGVQFGYKNPVTGEADFDDDDDDEDEDDEGKSNDAVNSLVKNLLTSDGDEDDEDDDESDGAGSLLRSLSDIDGTHVMIGGVELDLDQDGKSLVSDMVSNGLIVIDTGGIGYLFDENGDTSDVKFHGTKGDDGYNDEGYLEEYFDGKDLKDEYAGKIVYAGYSKDNTYPCTIYINDKRWFYNISNSALTSYTVPGGYNQLSKSDDFDDNYWLEVGFWGIHVSGEADLPRKCAIFADGEPIDLSEYVDEIDKIMKDNSMNDLFDYTDYFSQECRDADCHAIYGMLFSYDIGYARDGKYDDTKNSIDFNTEEHKNCAAINRALFDYATKMRDGEIKTLTIYTFEWDDRNELPVADLGINNYR